MGEIRTYEVFHCLGCDTEITSLDGHTEDELCEACIDKLKQEQNIEKKEERWSFLVGCKITKVVVEPKGSWCSRMHGFVVKAETGEQWLVFIDIDEWDCAAWISHKKVNDI